MSLRRRGESRQECRRLDWLIAHGLGSVMIVYRVRPVGMEKTAPLVVGLYIGTRRLDPLGAPSRAIQDSPSRSQSTFHSSCRSFRLRARPRSSRTLTLVMAPKYMAPAMIHMELNASTRMSA